jgi:hypothetical protein
MLTESGPTGTAGREGSFPSARPSQPVDHEFAPVGAQASGGPSSIMAAAGARAAASRSSPRRRGRPPSLLTTADGTPSRIVERRDRPFRPSLTTSPSQRGRRGRTACPISSGRHYALETDCQVARCLEDGRHFRDRQGTWTPRRLKSSSTIRPSPLSDVL